MIRPRRAVLFLLLVKGGILAAWSTPVVIDFASSSPHEFELRSDGYANPHAQPRLTTVDIREYSSSYPVLEARLPFSPLGEYGYFVLAPKNRIRLEALHSVRSLALSVFGRAERIGVSVLLEDSEGAAFEFFMGYLDFDGRRELYYRLHYAGDVEVVQPVFVALVFYAPAARYPRYSESVVCLQKLELDGDSLP